MSNRQNLNEPRGAHSNTKTHSFLNKRKNDKNKVDIDTTTTGSEKVTDFFEKGKAVILKVISAITSPIAIIVAVAALIILIVYTTVSRIYDLIDGDDGYRYATGEYYKIICKDVTVYFTDKKNNYKTTGIGTYPLEEYIAGVLKGEVGEYNNLEVYKEYAVAARSYFAEYSSRNNTCVVESSDKFQVFVPSPNALMRQAAEETKGQVLLDENGNVMRTEYDAFCVDDIDDNYYTLRQKNQKIPRYWADVIQKGKINEVWKQKGCIGNHGRGSSQWGSYYLATEKGYNYGQLLSYYYSTEDNPIKISSSSFTSSVANLQIKNTTNASYKLSRPISDFLREKGSSLDNYNNYIKDSVNTAGYGTRDGVVAAVVSMINYLYDNFDTKLPYYWEGQPNTIGIPNDFGMYSPSAPSRPSYTTYYYKSFDCSGLVRWAIINGGYGYIGSFSSKFSGCNITDSSCVGQPGDVIDTDSHIVMIVSVDEKNNQYYVAESTSSGVIIRTHGMHNQLVSGETTKILKLDSYYNDKSNVINRG